MHVIVLIEYLTNRQNQSPFKGRGLYDLHLFITFEGEPRAGEHQDAHSLMAMAFQEGSSMGSFQYCMGSSPSVTI